MQYTNYAEYYTIVGKKLKPEERTDFGLPDKKAYPMPDKEHVRLAISMFHYAKAKDKPELARNIIKYMKKYGMTDMKIDKDSAFGKYYYK